MEAENSNLIDVSLAQDGGVMKEIIKEGTPSTNPSAGSKVTVHYTGTLLDGTKFDSSRDRGEKFTFNLGQGEVIKAWDQGVASMNKGELCKLICKSEYAYGEAGSPPKIPPNSTLIFEVELFDYKGEDLTTDQDGGIIRKILTAGQGFDNPNDEALVEVKIIGKEGENVFDDRTLKFYLGQGIDQNLPDGVELALQKFKNTEHSIITLEPKYGFGAAGNNDLGVTPNATLTYDIHLLNYEKSREVWEMDQVEKLEKAKLAKERGTEYFSKQKYNLALKEYKKIPTYLSFDSGLTDEQKLECSMIKKAGFLNLSLCYFKMKDYIEAKDNATKALEVEEDNVKALFRRGKANIALQDIEMAMEDLGKALQLDPNNKAVGQEMKICKKVIDDQKKKDRQLYQGMFDKFANTDHQRSKNGMKSDVMSGDMGEWDTAQKKSMDEEEEEPTDFKDIENIEMI